MMMVDDGRWWEMIVENGLLMILMMEQESTTTKQHPQPTTNNHKSTSWVLLFAGPPKPFRQHSCYICRSHQRFGPWNGAATERKLLPVAFRDPKMLVPCWLWRCVKCYDTKSDTGIIVDDYCLSSWLFSIKYESSNKNEWICCCLLLN